MDGLSGTTGVVALVALALGALALAACVWLAARLGRLRNAQRAVLGEHGTTDLVEHSAALERDFEELRGFVGETAQALHARLAEAEVRLDGAISHRALVRYDAYGEMSGRQSTSLALLDSSRSGVVVSSIHHRDQARLYVKIVREGRGELELSPEETEAVDAALGVQTATPAESPGAIPGERDAQAG